MTIELTPEQVADLIARLTALEGTGWGENKLDVQCEIAMFTPGTAYKAIRANSAGTKVIYTDAAGNDMTCWAEDWSASHRRRHTIAALEVRRD